MSYSKINNLLGLVAFAISMVVYTLTVEPTVSLWDCGEFISASYRLMVVHPPGAPLFLMLGRVFILLFGNDPMTAAWSVNMLSAFFSALTVMFTFWITTYFAKKLNEKLSGGELDGWHIAGIMAAGMVAALTLTFSDTFWFSAVEAEVYAGSSFFMAITFWAILKWEGHADEPHADRWLILIAYLAGLAIGVHLLNLLVIPSVVYVYYYRKYKPTRMGFIKATGVAFGILFFVQYLIIPGLPKMAAAFDKLFVNSFQMPFDSGVIAFLAILIAGISFLMVYSIRTRNQMLNTAMLSLVYILIGYSSYTMVVIRSRANPPIDMNNPEDPFSLTYYLNREQYGDRPLLYGPFFDAKMISVDKGKPRYVKGDDKYELVSHGFKPQYDPSRMTILPRMYDGNDSRHVRGYREWANIPESRKPNLSDNLTFMFKYQLGWMYTRYFFWNFGGRQNDEQGFGGNAAGNWLSGIAPVDAMRLGSQDKLPDTMTNHKARNRFFLLPFILGALGLFFQYKNTKNEFVVMLSLFVITGLLLIMYLNPPPYEPRERDYVFVGSFQAFCTWIGLGVLFLIHWLSQKTSRKMATVAVTAVALMASPVLMATQNWDDHDRSGRYMARDFAYNYLASCPKNAVLFTNGDNDTYPLWYAQNVEGFRTDVRIVNLSLLGADDYANGLRQKVYDGEPLKLTFTPRQILPGTRDAVDFFEDSKITRSGEHYELLQLMQFVANDEDRRAKAQTQGGDLVNFFPTKNFKLTVDREAVIKSGIVKPADAYKIENAITWTYPGNRVYKNMLLMLDIIANNWQERPICWTTTTGNDVYADLLDYMQLDGLVYRLTPIKQPRGNDREFGRIDGEHLYNLLVKTYTWGGMENREMFVDEKSKLVPQNIRYTFSKLADQLIMDGKKEMAIEALDHCLKSIPNHNLPFDYSLVPAVESYYRAGAKEKAAELIKTLTTDAIQRARYFNPFVSKPAANRDGSAQQEVNIANYIIESCRQIATQYGDKETADDIDRRRAMMP